MTTTIVVISQDNNDNNQVAQIVDDMRLESNVTCLCTEDEQCDENTRTCQLTHVHQKCYESWTLDPNDNSIHLTAG